MRELLKFVFPLTLNGLPLLPGFLLVLSGGCVGGGGDTAGDAGGPHGPRILTAASPTQSQAIQHIEGTQGQEEEQRRAVIVKPVRGCPEAHASDTASDSEASDSDAMDQGREEPAGNGGLP